MQSIKHNRRPYDCEITEEVAREYSRQQEDKRASAVVPGRDSSGMTSRVSIVEGSIARLEEKIQIQHSHLEGLLRELLGGHAVKSNPAVQQLSGPSTTLPETSMAAAVRVALAAEPCARVSLKDVDDTDGTQVHSEILVSAPSRANGTNPNVVGAANGGSGNMEAVPMDVEGVTESVEDAVRSVVETEVGDDQVRPDMNVYDMHDVATVEVTPAKVVDAEEQVCSKLFFLQSCWGVSHYRTSGN